MEILICKLGSCSYPRCTYLALSLALSSSDDISGTIQLIKESSDTDYANLVALLDSQFR